MRMADRYESVSIYALFFVSVYSVVKLMCYISEEWVLFLLMLKAIK